VDNPPQTPLQNYNLPPLQKLDPPRPFLDHLEELRRRLLVWLCCVPPLVAVGFFLWNPLAQWLSKPIGTIVFTHPADVLFARFKVAALIGFIFSAPVAIHQIWQFVSLGLRHREKKIFLYTVPVSCVLFFLGVTLSIFWVSPVAVKFLVGMGSAQLRPLITLDEYLSFLGWTAIGFGLAFQTPIVIVALCHVGLLNPETLAKRRREAIVIILLVAGIITPGPDIFSQLSLAIPCYILYELSLMLCRRIARQTSS